MTLIADDEHRRAERFLYHEARLLDERRYDDWLATLDETIEYVVFNRLVPEPRPRSVTPLDQEFLPLGAAQLSMDRIASLQYRVTRLNSGLTFTETPPGRTIRQVTNIEVWPGPEPDQLRVESCLHCNRSRKDDRIENFYARRKDVLGFVGDGLRLRQRHVYINETTLSASSVSILF